MDHAACHHLSDFLKTEMTIIRKHLDEHIYLRHIDDKTDAISSFISDYGWLMRELYCTRICEECSTCSNAQRLDKEGDLLRKRHAPDLRIAS